MDEAAVGSCWLERSEKRWKRGVKCEPVLVTKYTGFHSLVLLDVVLSSSQLV